MTEYRIDELARLAGTTVRNVRAYQERGLLLPPRRQGRAGLFDDAHLRRLRMIGQLLERGYSLANIGELLDAWEKGHAIDEVLGLGDAIPPRVTVAWLIEAFGPGPTRPVASGDPSGSDDPGGPGAPAGPGAGSGSGAASSYEATGDEPAALLAALDLGVLEPDDGEPAGFRVTNPRLLRAAIELARAGIPLAALAEHARGLRRDVERLARGFVDLVDTHLFGPLGDRLPTPAEAARLSELAQRLRPLADDVVVGELDRAIDHLTRQRLHERLTQLLDHPPDTA
ncbi:MAG TPA: MerR family transcriptional regulator [Acidimicrobiales bacterium]|nr:MerR family transcriptional regulator [Acidimicrobiales bacterium]